ncbi:hypothetical protein HDU96_008061 [Phlyctochytrium bullatum]|nr:hypothetical protein HDU96_008061 [Phlyctochytrium bullatum]
MLTLFEFKLAGPDFAGYPIPYDPENIQGFADEDSMTRFLNVNVSSPVDLGARLVLSHGCDPDNVVPALDTLRYQVSFWCARFVYDATRLGCSPPTGGLPNGPMLCPSECELAVQSFSSLVSDTPACPLALATEDQRTRRTGVVSTFSGYCTAYLNSGQSQCSAGVPQDSGTCGFRVPEVQRALCPRTSGDRCCNDFVASLSSTSTSTTVSSRTTTTSSTVTTTTTTSKNANSNALLDPLTSPAPQTVVVTKTAVIQQTVAALPTETAVKQQSSSPSSSSLSAGTLFGMIFGAIAIVVVGVTVAAMLIIRSRRSSTRLSRQNMFQSSVTPSYSVKSPTYGKPQPPTPGGLVRSKTAPALPYGPASASASSFSTATPLSASGSVPALSAMPSPGIASTRMRADSAASAHVYAAAQLSASANNQYYPPTTPKTPTSATPFMQGTPGNMSPSPYSAGIGMDGAVSGPFSAGARSQQPPLSATPSNPPLSAGLAREHQNRTMAATATSSSTQHTNASPQKSPSLTKLATPQPPPRYSVATANALSAATQPPPLPRIPTTATTATTSANATSGDTAPLVMKVLHAYSPVLADELELKLHQDIIILKCFDDGWGLGMLPSTGAQGAFPLVCVLATAPSQTSLSSATPLTPSTPHAHHLHHHRPLPSATPSDFLPSAMSSPQTPPLHHNPSTASKKSAAGGDLSLIASTIEQQVAAQAKLELLMARSGVVDIGSAGAPLRRGSSRRAVQR